MIQSLRIVVILSFSLAFCNATFLESSSGLSGVSAWKSSSYTTRTHANLICSDRHIFSKSSQQRPQRSLSTALRLSSQDGWVSNPETGRLIKPNGPRWRDLMHHTGGYIANDSELIPIDKEALWKWENQSPVLEAASIPESGAKYCNTCWHPLSPVVAADPQVSLKDDDETLPFLDQLLFVHKPSGLLTLPGIGADKQICLASLINDWLAMEGHNEEALAVLRKARVSASQNSIRKRLKRKKQTRPFVPRPCHRLDFDTSGVLVIGLTRDALRLTNALFEAKDDHSFLLQKTYVALVAGHVVQNEGIVDFPYVSYSINDYQYPCL
jgi:hypothetical protein